MWLLYSTCTHVVCVCQQAFQLAWMIHTHIYIGTISVYDFAWLHIWVHINVCVCVCVHLCKCVLHWTWPKTVSQRRCQLWLIAESSSQRGSTPLSSAQPDLFLWTTDWGKSLLILCRRRTTDNSDSGFVSTCETARMTGTQQFGDISLWLHSGSLSASLKSFIKGLCKL